MRRVIRYVVSLGSFAGLWTDAVTAEVATSYDLIPQKNVFKLREPVVELPPTNRIEPPRMTLIGISTLGARKLAFLKPTAGPAAARQGAAAATADQTIMLAVGERQGDIEVVDIDAAAGRVMIRQAGELVNVVFEKEAPRSNPPANVAGEPGAAQPNPNPPGGAAPVMQTSLTNQSPAPAPPLPVAQPGYATKRTLPSRNGAGTPPPPPLPGGAIGTAPAPAQAQAPANNQLSPEEQQQLLNEIERLKNSPY